MQRRTLWLWAGAAALAGASALVWTLRRPAPAEGGAEAAAVQIPWQPIVDAATRSARTGLAGKVTNACREPTCACAEAAAAAALDLEQTDRAKALLDAAPASCSNQALLRGLRAELAARSGDTDRAEHLAHTALEQRAENAYAQMALALAAFEARKMGATKSAAERAASLGRGAEAERLLGKAAIAQGRFEEAKAHFDRVLAAAPQDLEAAFNTAVASDRLNRYGETREAFLRVLRIDPKHAQARFYLAALTHRAGAKAEAEHHRKKLGELVPEDDPRLKQLEVLLAQPANDAAVVGGAVQPSAGRDQ